MRDIDEMSLTPSVKDQKHKETLTYLEGVLPMSPPESFSGRGGVTSSIYSRDEWGTPSEAYSEEDRAQRDREADRRTRDGDRDRGKGKEKGIDWGKLDNSWV